MIWQTCRRAIAPGTCRSCSSKIAASDDRRLRQLARLLKLERVADQVLKKLPHLQRIGLDRRQRVQSPSSRRSARSRTSRSPRHLAHDLRRDRTPRTAARGWSRARASADPGSASACAARRFACARGNRAPARRARRRTSTCSRSPNAWILRSGSCRSCEATHAKFCSSALLRSQLRGKSPQLLLRELSVADVRCSCRRAR